MTDPNVFDRFGYKPILARVDAIDYQVDGKGEQVKDDLGNPVPTGLLSITFLEKGGGREKVPFVMPVAGNSMFAGGLPELGSLCLVAFRQGNDPVIQGFLPPSLHSLMNSRQTVPNLVPGELFFQASIPDYDVDAQANFFAGANVYFDRYGRYRIVAHDYEFIIGYVLSSEFTPSVTRFVDPVTGQPIYMREKVKGTERRIDDLGNAVFSFPKNHVEQIGGDKSTTVSGAENKVSKRGFSWGDGKGNSVELKDTGEMVITLNGGSLQITSMGNVTHESGANLSDVVSEEKSLTVGGNVHNTIGGQRLTQIGGDDTKTVVEGDAEEHVMAGRKLIRALNIILEATAGTVALGSEDASHPVPRGDDLLTILIGSPPATPITPTPSILGSLYTLSVPLDTLAGGTFTAVITGFFTTLATTLTSMLASNVLED